VNDSDHEESTMAEQRAERAALRWLARQLEWERKLTALRDARDGSSRMPRRDCPAA
jgi:hypothetical protein